MRRILAFIFSITFALNLTFATTSFLLILNKEGTTNIGFYDGYTDSANQITRLTSLSSPDNTSSASASFYVKANIFSDIFSTTDENYTLSITFFANENNEDNEDFMLIHETESNVGLVYDYQIAKNITDGSVDEDEGDIMCNVSFNDSSLRDNPTSLDNRTKVLLEGTGNDTKSEVFQIIITINPPQTKTEDEESGEFIDAFTSGQYMGYVRLELVSN